MIADFLKMSILRTCEISKKKSRQDDGPENDSKQLAQDVLALPHAAFRDILLQLLLLLRGAAETHGHSLPRRRKHLPSKNYSVPAAGVRLFCSSSISAFISSRSLSASSISPSFRFLNRSDLAIPPLCQSATSAVSSDGDIVDTS